MLQRTVGTFAAGTMQYFHRSACYGVVINTHRKIVLISHLAPHNLTKPTTDKEPDVLSDSVDPALVVETKQRRRRAQSVNVVGLHTLMRKYTIDTNFQWQIRPHDKPNDYGFVGG